MSESDGGLQRKAVENKHEEFVSTTSYTCNLCGVFVKAGPVKGAKTKRRSHAHLSDLTAKELELKERRRIEVRRRRQREAWLRNK